LIFDGFASTGASGVAFNSGAQLNISGCAFLGFAAGGITFSPGAGSAAIAKMVVEKSNIFSNGSGVVVSPSAGIVANVTLTRVRTDGNSGDGVIVDGTAGGGAIDVAIANASIGFNAGNGVNAVSGSGSVTIDIFRSTIETNGLAGILSNQSGGGSSSVTVGSTQIGGNGVGMQSAGGGGLRSYSNNQVMGNQTTGNFTGSVGLQ